MLPTSCIGRPTNHPPTNQPHWTTTTGHFNGVCFFDVAFNSAVEQLVSAQITYWQKQTASCQVQVVAIAYGPFTATQLNELNSTRRRVGLSCVAINGPLLMQSWLIVTALCLTTRSMQCDWLHYTCYYLTIFTRKNLYALEKNCSIRETERNDELQQHIGQKCH